LFIFFLTVSQNVFPQAVFDTLFLHEFEVIAVKDDYRHTFKRTEIDTLVRKEFEHYDLGELLTAFSPVFIKSYGKGSIASASFRGTAASHTQVLWNGFAINSPMLGQVDFSSIPDSFFDEVELLFGGGSLYEQSGALGGAVLLNNFSGNKSKPKIHINQSAGSFGTFNSALSVNLGENRFRSETAAVLQTSQNDFEYYNNGVLPPEWMTQQNASFLNTGFQQHFSFQQNAHSRFDVITWNQWNHRNIPPIMTNVYKGGDPEEYQDDFFSRNMFNWSFHKNKHELTVKAAYFYEDQHYYLKTTTSEDSSVVTLIDSRNRSNGYYLKSGYSKQLNRSWELTAGVDLSCDVVKSNNYEESKDRNTESFYGGVKKELWDRLTLNALVRLDITDGELLPVMPFAGINLQLLNNESLFLRATVARNYHLPTLNDLYWYPGGNPDLQPEDAVEFDAGFNYLKEFSGNTALSFDVTGFYSSIHDWIQWKPSDYRFWVPENIGYVKARGAEVSCLLSGEFSDVFYRLSGKYAYTKTSDESEEAVEGGYAGRQMIYIPVHHGNLFAYVSFKGWSLSWLTVFTGERNTTTDPAEDYSNVLPYYALNDLQAGKKIDLKKTGLGLFFKVNNLFNVQYQAVLWRAMPGTNFEFSVRFDLK
jgi:iron complex outermembrane receptor protein